MHIYYHDYSKLFMMLIYYKEYNNKISTACCKSTKHKLEKRYLRFYFQNCSIYISIFYIKKHYLRSVKNSNRAFISVR